MAPATEISVDVPTAAVSPESDGVFTLDEEQKNSCEGFSQWTRVSLHS